jgi:hypothetical protein
MNKDKHPAPASDVEQAAKELIDAMFWQYRSGNGRMMSIEDTHGEKCWIVPDDNIERLKAAIRQQASLTAPAKEGGEVPQSAQNIIIGYEEFDFNEAFTEYELIHILKVMIQYGNQLTAPTPAPVEQEDGRCGCIGVEIGTYTNQIEVVPPPHMKAYYTKHGGAQTICIDTCLVVEVWSLWKLGITTTGCCCGHNKMEGFIGVIDDDIPRMKAMGYKVAFNSSRPGDEDSFVARSTPSPQQAEAVDEWISVEDGLPELPPPYYEDGMLCSPLTRTAIVFDGESVYTDSYDKNGFNSTFVTH